ncbi:hypothetical protein MRX96_007559 [Rhipicephalus microplus]
MDGFFAPRSSYRPKLGEAVRACECPLLNSVKLRRDERGGEKRRIGGDDLSVARFPCRNLGSGENEEVDGASFWPRDKAKPPISDRAGNNVKQTWMAARRLASLVTSAAGFVFLVHGSAADKGKAGWRPSYD